MKRVITTVGSIMALAILAISMAFASPVQKPKHHVMKHTMHHAKTMSMKCPACGMTLSMHKSKMTPVAVKMHGKTMYCCARCHMKAMAGHKMAAKHHALKHKSAHHKTK
ncbi:MAG: hypothetical protein KGJ62_13375 [Armatimonadetes bacterium]|nr:hypothetical protein [Armatimonadota bacterium]MDE2206847.1 hypothetical protein [Armatimonadota bacterium]